MTSIILNGKKISDILISKFWTVKLSYSYMKHLYQMIKYITWLRTSYTNKQPFFNLLQDYNSICPNLSCLVIFMIRWWWTNNNCSDLTLSRQFWGVCLRESKIFKICLFIYPTERAVFWKANFTNYSRNLFIKWYQFLYSMSNAAWAILCFISGKGSPVCLSLPKSCHIMLKSHVSLIINNNNKCNRVKGEHWIWLTYTLCRFLLCNNMLRVFRSNHYCSWNFPEFYRKTPVLESLFSLKWWNYIKTFVLHE